MVRRYSWLLVAVALCAACGGVTREAEKHIKSGALQEAERLLVTSLRDKPGDFEVRFLLGKVYMLEQRPEDATTVLEPFRTMPKWPSRVAQTYVEAATSLEKEGHASTLADYLLQSTRFDPSKARASCDAMLKIALARAPSGDYAPLVGSAAAIDGDCRRKAVAQIMAAVNDADPAAVRASDLEAIGKAGATINSDTTRDVARAIRKLASRAAESDKTRAAEILRAALRVDETISGELETVVLRSSLLPPEPAEYDSYEQQKTRALFDMYAGSPAEATQRILLKIGKALDAYATDFNRYPLSYDIASLRLDLGRYANDLPWADGWGKEIEYISAKDSWSARLISGGADNYIEYGSRQLSVPPKGAMASTSADIIWENGRIAQYPGAGADELPLPLPLRR